MVIFFSEKNPESIVDKLKSIMSGRELGKMVSFNLAQNELIVTIAKLGTSTLTFSRQASDEGCRFSLTKEKIALSHRPMKREVTNKIIKVIEQAGGEVSA